MRNTIYIVRYKNHKRRDKLLNNAKFKSKGLIFVKPKEFDTQIDFIDQVLEIISLSSCELYFETYINRNYIGTDFELTIVLLSSINIYFIRILKEM